MSEKPRILYENRVRFEETDLQGVVFYGNYLTYHDETVSAFFRRIGYEDSQWSEGSWSVHVAHVSLDYRSTATFGDVLQHTMRVTGFGRSSIRSEYHARHREDGTPVVEGEAVHVAIDGDSGETRPVPDPFRQAVRDYQAVPPGEASGSGSG